MFVSSGEKALHGCVTVGDGQELWVARDALVLERHPNGIVVERRMSAVDLP
jgi:hypothetical protein